MRKTPRRCTILEVLFSILLFLLVRPIAASANCNVIPAATKEFRGALGSLNRPFASPGDYVEIRVRPALCDGRSSGFLDLDSDGSITDDHVVTLFFEPPPLAGGPPRAVVLAEDCGAVDFGSCSELSLGPADCITVNQSGPPFGLVETADASGAPELQVRFPDTDDRLGSVGDGLGLTGPAAIAVTQAGAPLPCQLVAPGGRCAGLGDTVSTGAVACVDEFYALDGTCGTSAQQIDRIFGHFTALPPPNDFEQMVGNPANTDVRLATDLAGHALVPMNYGGILLRVEGIPVPQLARTSTGLEAFQDSGEPMELPSDALITSYSPQGVILPPIFTPLRDPSPGPDATLFGSVDADRGVFRIGRLACVGGDQDGMPCTTGAECTGGGTCDALFEFRDRYALGAGPVVIARNGGYSAALDSAVPLEGLVQSSETFAFVVSEGIDGLLHNDDTDTTDFVVTLRDRETGMLQPIGQNGAEGRAVSLIKKPPFRFPAVTTEGNLVAFLEAEALEGDCPTEASCDANGDLDASDSILRLYRLGEPGELASATVESEPVVNGEPVAISEGTVFFRASERAAAETRVSPFSFRARVISGDGRWIFSAASFTTSPQALDRDPDENGVFDEGNQVMQALVGFGSADGISSHLASSRDGRHVLFFSWATNLTPDPDLNGGIDLLVLDRDHDEDGVFDETDAGATKIVRISVDSGGSQLPALAGGLYPHADISSDGSIISYTPYADLLPEDSGGGLDAYLHDRDADGNRVFDEPGGIATTLLTPTPPGSVAATGFTGASSSDGRWVVYTQLEVEPGETCQTSSTCGIWVFDVMTGGRVRVDVSSSGVAAAYPSAFPAPRLSADGRFVLLRTGEALVSGDTNGSTDLYLHDRDSDEDGVFDESGATSISRVSLAADGSQLPAGLLQNFSSAACLPYGMSLDGERVLFNTELALVADDTNADYDIYTIEVDTGLVKRVSLGPSGNELVGVGNPCRSEDLRSFSFYGRQTTFSEDFLSAPDPTDPLGAEITGDGDLADAVLTVVDASGTTVTASQLCPATRTAVAAGRAAFLRPESAGATTNPGCSGLDLSGPDLNADGDEADEIVHLYDGMAVQNLRCAAEDVALSSTRLAALVSEADDALSASVNGDLDEDDLVVHVRAVDAGVATACDGGSGWVNVGQAASAVAVNGDYVVFATEEADQGNTPLNGDGDPDDRILQVYDAAAGLLVDFTDPEGIPVDPQAVEEFVVGEGLVAFRTSEAAQGENLNPDHDSDIDDVILQVYDLVEEKLISSQQTATPCRLVACDPRSPYRVGKETVRFLTLEAQQGEDLNDDGDQLDLLVQVFHPRTGAVRVLAEVVDTGATLEKPALAVDPLGGSGSGDPEGGPSGSTALMSEGLCVEDQATPCTVGQGGCAAGEICASADGITGTCSLPTGVTCIVDAAETGCAPESTCVAQKTAIGVADSDGDESPNGLDNCPDTPNPDQADRDRDGVGDVCDAQTCGDGVLDDDPGTGDPLEECDDGNADSGDGCDASCTVEAGFGCTGEPSVCTLITDECDDGLDNDGDGFVDLADPGCSYWPRPGAREDPECSDGIDNDSDGRVDYPNDSGCTGPSDPSERPECDDGIDNDSDGWIDHPQDPQCKKAKGKTESAIRRHCGIGGELTLVLAPLLWLTRRRRRRRG